MRKILMVLGLVGILSGYLEFSDDLYSWATAAVSLSTVNGAVTQEVIQDTSYDFDWQGGMAWDEISGGF